MSVSQQRFWLKSLNQVLVAVASVRAAAEIAGDPEIAGLLLESNGRLLRAITILERRAKVVEPPLIPNSANTGDPTK